MSDTSASDGTPDTPVHDPMTPEAIEGVLAEFRTWLADLNSPVTASSEPSPPGVDLFTLVGQFTALRHDVNMQTKAARAAVEQTSEVLRFQAAAAPKPIAGMPSEDELRSMV